MLKGKEGLLYKKTKCSKTKQEKNFKNKMEINRKYKKR